MGTSIPPGKGLCAPEDSLRFDFLGDAGDRDGENPLSSEKDVVEETGDVLPPQLKKVPTFNAAGDLGGCLFVLAAAVSLDALRNVALFDSVS